MSITSQSKNQSHVLTTNEYLENHTYTIHELTLHINMIMEHSFR